MTGLVPLDGDDGKPAPGKLERGGASHPANPNDRHVIYLAQSFSSRPPRLSRNPADKQLLMLRRRVGANVRPDAPSPASGPPA